jgi:allophanate hydrolase
MIHWSQGLFGFVGDLQPLTDSLTPFLPAKALDKSAATPPQTPPSWDGDLSIGALTAAYKNGLSPLTVVDAIYNRIEAYHAIDSGVWITLETREAAIAQAENLISKFSDRSKLPVLFGVPFSVKDSIDVKGVPTTTACPPLAFVPPTSAVVYEKCIAEGAIYIGKTNLDQLATGLSGCRSPYGIPHSVFNKNYISGGSSSGNAVSVGAHLVSFSLATDTAGSGRVPAALNGVVGYKPTRGTVSFQGVTPACLSLDCCSFMATTVEDVRTVWQVCEGYDADDRYAKETPPLLRHVNSIGPQVKTFNFGIPPPEALSMCNPVYRRLFNEAVKKLQSIGGVLVEIDWSPFDKAGNLLYEGTFVSERMASLPDGWLETNRDHLHPVIREIFETVASRQSTAVQAYRDLQAKALYTRQASQIFSYGPKGISVLLVPSTTTHWTIEEMLADPIKRNSALGYFTHSGNVLDLTGVAVPASEYSVNELTGSSESSADSKLPFGVTFLGGSRTDYEVLEIARRFTEAT